MEAQRCEPDVEVGCGSERSWSLFACTGDACPCAPPEAGAGCCCPRSWPKLLEDTAKENLPGRVRALWLCPAPWGTCTLWGDPIHSPKRWQSGLCPAIPKCPGCPRSPSLPCCPPGYPDHMVFAEFRRRFDVLAPHLTKKHGRNYIVVDEKRVRALHWSGCCGLGSPAPRGSLAPWGAASPALTPLRPHRRWRSSWSRWTWRRAATTWA